MEACLLTRSLSEARHFPRTDAEYLAQLKKMAADRGLTIAALADMDFFTAAAEHAGEFWSEAVTASARQFWPRRLRVKPEVPGAQKLSAAEYGDVACKVARTSRWHFATRRKHSLHRHTTANALRKRRIRHGCVTVLQPQALDIASDPRLLAPNTILLWSDAADESDRTIADILGAFPDFRGHLALDESSGAATVAALRASVHRWQRAMLNRR